MGTGRAEGQGQTQAKPEPGSLRGTQEGSGGTEGVRDLGGEAVMGNGSNVAMLSLRGEGWREWLDPSIRLSQDIVQKVLDRRSPGEGWDLRGQRDWKRVARSGPSGE